MRRLKSIFWFLIGFWLIFSLGLRAYAADITFEVRKKCVHYLSGELDDNLAAGGELRLSYKNIFVFADIFDKANLRWCGQDAGGLDILGLGLGFQVDFATSERLTLTPWGKLGYYYIQAEAEDRWWTQESNFSIWEALLRQQWKLVGDRHHWHRMLLKMENDAIGAGLGLDFTYRCTNHLSLVLGSGMSFLRTSYELTGKNTCHNTYWSANGSLDLRSTQAWLGLVWRF